MVSLFVEVGVSKDFFSATGLDAEGKELSWGSYEINQPNWLRRLHHHPPA